MSRKIVNEAGVPCGCKTLFEHGREAYAAMCIQHEKEFDERHAAATAIRLRHVNRDNHPDSNLDLIGE